MKHIAYSFNIDETPNPEVAKFLLEHVNFEFEDESLSKLREIRRSIMTLFPEFTKDHMPILARRVRRTKIWKL